MLIEAPGAPPPPPMVTPSGGSTLSAEACATWKDDVAGHFDGIEGITSVEVVSSGDMCAGEGTYTVRVEAQAAPSADQVTATWDAFADAWDSLDLESVAYRYPDLSVSYGNSLIETNNTVLRLDDRTASAFGKLVAGSWSAVFRAALMGSTDLATTHPERQVLRLWYTEDPEAGLGSDASVFVDMWEAAAEAAAVAGWSGGEIGLSAYSAVDMSLPVAAAAQAPDGLAEAFVKGYEFGLANPTLDISPVRQKTDEVSISVEPADEGPARPEGLDSLEASIESLGLTVRSNVGYVYM